MADARALPADESGLLEMIRTLQSYPVAFVRVILSAQPSPQQEQLLRAAAKHGAHVSVTSGHGTGKSTCLAWLILWHVSCFHNSKVGVTAPTAPQLQSVLWAEVFKWHKQMHPYFKSQVSVTADTVCVAGAERTQFAVARTARSLFPLADKASDEPTADLLTQRLTVHEQTAWMLRSLLEE